MFGNSKNKQTTASEIHPTRQLSAEEAPRELARAGFRCYGYLSAGVEVAGIDKKDNGWVYEVYTGQSRNSAIAFLQGIPNGCIPEGHYVIVETPQGNLGRDVLGMFDE